jgi:hypothetical protein
MNSIIGRIAITITCFAALGVFTHLDQFAGSTLEERTCTAFEQQNGYPSELCDERAPGLGADNIDEGPLATDGDAGIECQRLADGSVGACTPNDPAMATYDRDQFGTAWTDTDHDCLNTRAEILARDGQGVRISGCHVVAGRWVDPYTGVVETDPSRVHIDHVYPLAEAWRQGASDWPKARRQAFANDPRNLMALTAQVNVMKTDQDSSEWCTWQRGERVKEECPVTGSDTAYAQRYNQVAAAYGLG